MRNSTNPFAADRFIIRATFEIFSSWLNIMDENNSQLLYFEHSSIRDSRLSFYSDYSKQKKVMRLKRFVTSFWETSFTYALTTHDGSTIAFLRKSAFNGFKIKWDVIDLEGNHLATALEDSNIYSLIRKMLLFRRYGHISFSVIKGGSTIGTMTRTNVFHDIYVVDFSADRDRTFDRRTAMALATLVIMTVSARI